MAEGDVLVRPEALQSFVAELFERAGMPAADAETYAWSLVQTNLWGIDSHGVLRTAVYVKRVQSGAVNPRPDIHKVRGALAFEVLHGDDGSGPIVAKRAMERAIELAGQFGVGVVGAMHSNHFGAAALYARMASARGMVGIAMTNVVPNVVAPGGSKPVVGNNPLAIAIPTYGDFPFVLDMSMSAVAGGKLLLASKKGEKIPLDWATDKSGRPTDDPDVAFAGFLLPMGGYKGLGLAYAVDILAGVLTGGVFLDEMKGMYKFPDDPSLTGHFMIAINVEAVMGKDEMQSRMAAFVQKVKASPMWDATKEMLIPGEIEHRIEQRRRAEGIPVPPKLFEELNQLAETLGATRTLAAPAPTTA
ncbi:MAG TPA: Ldh family oxidoreductase [Anaerolineae bacterium]